MPNPFQDQPKRWPARFMPATKADLLAMEERLRQHMNDLARAVEGDKERLQLLTDALKHSALALQEAVNQNQPQERK